MTVSIRFVVEIILGALLLLPLLLVMIDTFFRTLFLITTVGFIHPKRPKKVDAVTQDLKLLILVVANNEERIIGHTLQLLLEAMGDSTFVTLALLADNCTDQTPQIAATREVKLYLREDGHPGKGRALSWLTSCAAEDILSYDLIAILDADTIISADFCHNAKEAFSSSDTRVIQSFVQPVNENGMPLATLAAYSEILSQRIDDEARNRLGWTAPLRGTGMVFRSAVFLQACERLQTQVDDIELSLRLVELKIPVVYCPQLKIFDPKSSSILGLARQRGRWLRGQRDVWAEWEEKLKTLTGFSEWSLLHAIILKPKVALIVTKTALLGIFYFLNIDFLAILYLLIVLSLCMDFIYYITGLRYVSEPRRYLISFLSAPLFLAMWVAGWFFSFGRQGQWLRVRD